MESWCREKLTGGVEGLLKGNKVEIVRGEAYFVDENTVRVMTENSAQTYKFKMPLSQQVLAQSSCRRLNFRSACLIQQVH